MDFAHPEYLVTTDWLEEHLDGPGVVVLDVTAKLTSRLDNEPAADVWAVPTCPALSSSMWPRPRAPCPIRAAACRGRGRHPSSSQRR